MISSRPDTEEEDLNQDSSMIKSKLFLSFNHCIFENF